jgi:hypothetical protein
MTKEESNKGIDFMEDDNVSSFVGKTKMGWKTKLQIKVVSFLARHKYLGFALGMLETAVFLVGLYTSLKWIIINISKLF